jgi:serine phosphatase RsbU (regulator of sigma subunit)/DNA-binding response OmpR family regulator/anti-sigma regulatory factor (Ser/Thr protein kinase)
VTRSGIRELDGADGESVLLVDDRLDNLVALRAVLEPLGVPVITASSGDEALRRLLAEEFALILLDVQMPGMDGFSTAAMIKQHPRTADVPIIFLTAFDERLDDADVGYSSGAVDYLTKPVDPHILRSKVRVFLDLHRKSNLLARQTRQLEAHIDELKRSRAALADAQRLAHLGSWVLDPATGRVRGTEQLHHVLDQHVDEPLPLAPALFGRIQVTSGPPLLDRLLGAVDHVSAEGRLALRNGRTRHVVVHAEPTPDDDGTPRAVVGTIQDVTEQRAAAEALERANRALEHERDLVQLLQRAVAPAEVPELAELDIATSYRPAGAGLVGGDWYDVLPLPDGTVLLVIGDVAGHGLPAAAAMSQIRTALRVVLLRERSPGAIVADVNRFVLGSDIGTFATMAVVRLDPGTGACTMAAAGHVPPILLGDTVEVVDLVPGPPLGSGLGSRYVETAFGLGPGQSLLLYTDGLVERRGEVIDDGIVRLCKALDLPMPSSAALADHVIQELCADLGNSDDIALLVARRHEPSSRLRFTSRAQTSRLGQVRLTVGRWLGSLGAEQEQIDDVVLAVGELATNVCLHAYPPFVAGLLHLEAELDVDHLRVVVRDEGRWRAEPSPGGGRGLPLLAAMGFELEHDHTDEGTTATMTTTLRRPSVPTDG